MIGYTWNYRFYVEPVGISPFASFSRYDKGGQTRMKQVGTCNGFAGIVLQVGRDFIAPVTVSMEKCSRWNISSLIGHLHLWPSGSEKPETASDGTGFAAFGRKKATVRQTLTLNCAWRFTYGYYGIIRERKFCLFATRDATHEESHTRYAKHKGTPDMRIYLES